MSKAFYPRLALSNIKKNGKTYFPFILTCVCTIAMFYIMLSISQDHGIDSMTGANELRLILMFAGIIIAIFSAIFLFYTNSFLFKRRKKELGLYNILGLGKRHIAKMMFFETLFIALISLILGLAAGIVLSRLMFLVLLKLLKFKVTLGFYVSVKSIWITVLLFAAIFVLTLFSNLFHVTLSNPINLLRGGNTGEKEPKTKWLLVVIGVLTLGAGYAIAILVESPLQALFMFLIAVILVMIGTYSLFTAGSIAFLKHLRKKKNYYYTPQHFISVSGMIYRMKQNAVGLANICILSCAVLMLFAGSVSLYAGANDIIRERYPRDVQIYAHGSDPNKFELINAAVEKSLPGHSVTLSNKISYRYALMARYRNGNAFYIGSTSSDLGMKAASQINMIPLSDYNAFEGKNESLAPDEVLIFSKGKNYGGSTVSFGGSVFRVKEELESIAACAKKPIVVINEYYIVFDSEETIRTLYCGSNENSEEDSEYTLFSYTGFDVSGEKDETLAFFDTLSQNLSGFEHTSMESRQQSMESFLAVYGGLLFIGIFLGLLFLMAAVLIIYYKQVSEGYDDKQRYEIMRNVGMSLAEIRKTVKSQILLVFFLPLAAAVVHIAFAFKLMTRLLAALNLVNIPLTLLCTAGTVALYALVYAAVYALTARTYYRIVK